MSNNRNSFAIISIYIKLVKLLNKKVKRPDLVLQIAKLKVPKHRFDYVKDDGFISSDGVRFEVDELFTVESNIDKNMVEYGCVNGGLTLRVTSNILSKVIDFCNKHAEARNTDEKLDHDNLKEFDSEFVKVDYTTLIDLIRVRILLLFIDMTFGLLIYTLCNKLHYTYVHY